MGGSILRIRTSSINFSQSGLLGDLGDITKTLRKAIQCSSLSSCSYGARKTKQNNQLLLKTYKHFVMQIAVQCVFQLETHVIVHHCRYKLHTTCETINLYISDRVNSLFKKCFNFDVGCSSRTVMTTQSPLFLGCLSKLRTNSIRAW